MLNVVPSAKIIISQEEIEDEKKLSLLYIPLHFNFDGLSVVSRLSSRDSAPWKMGESS